MEGLVGLWLSMATCCCSCLGLGSGPSLTDIWNTGCLKMSSGNEAALYIGCWLAIFEDGVWFIGWVRLTAEGRAILHLGCLVITEAGGLTGFWFVVCPEV